MSLRFDTLSGSEIADVIDHVADLRISVFREWPYLYAGDRAYEQTYLRNYATTSDAIVVIARDGERIVGASTGLPIKTADPALADVFRHTHMDLAAIFYCAESVLLPEFRGQGAGHRFFDLREAHARALGYRYAAFCSVIRPDTHPARPDGHRPLDGFWRARGYTPCEGAVAHLAWRDLDSPAESLKPLQFWMRIL